MSELFVHRRVEIISTGGTIEKTYDEVDGTLVNRSGVLDSMLNKLVLNGVILSRVPLMNKDSLDMTPDDFKLIAEQSVRSARAADGVIVVHGTDRLANSGQHVFARVDELEAPVVFTGAMRPFAMHNTDALQNLTEALLAVQLLPVGVFVAMHNRVLAFPRVKKDHDLRTFVPTAEPV